jgi:hypothetical protein
VRLSLVLAVQLLLLEQGVLGRAELFFTYRTLVLLLVALELQVPTVLEELGVLAV